MNTIIGRITKNAEINHLKNDKQVVNFSVAINDSYRTKDGERKEQSTYYNCSYWISPNVAPLKISQEFNGKKNEKGQLSAPLTKPKSMKPPRQFSHSLSRFTPTEKITTQRFQLICQKPSIFMQTIN